ncbi:MAG TPA: TatD family hydrolase [Acidimicrobiales bacterium]|nr:TatD family hydrolase [Acidimicrobiales bacterium]
MRTELSERSSAIRERIIDPGSWTDSHCHLHDLEDVPGLLERSRAANVDRLICIGTSEESSHAAISLAKRSSESDHLPMLWATVGQHPHDATSDSGWLLQLLERSKVLLPRGPKPPGSIVAVGECGLDFHYNYSPPDAQREAFILQISLARLFDLALVVHTRSAWQETFDLLESELQPERVVIHCFTGGPDEARRCLDLGAYLSFSGIATFKNAEDIRRAVDLCPIDRLLIETDAPYLAPVPHRGTPNEPAFVSLVGVALAKRKGIDVDEFARHTSNNAVKAFGISSG